MLATHSTNNGNAIIKSGYIKSVKQLNNTQAFDDDSNYIFFALKDHSLYSEWYTHTFTISVDCLIEKYNATARLAIDNASIERKIMQKFEAHVANKNYTSKQLTKQFLQWFVKHYPKQLAMIEIITTQPVAVASTTV